MKNTLLISFILLAFIAACDKTNENVGDEPKHTKPVFITNLLPVDDDGAKNDVSENVIQGITAFENGWFVTQKSGNSILLVNYLDENGISLFHKRLSLNSHGQDLSLEQISDNEIFLYTTTGTFSETRNTGMIKLLVEIPETNSNSRDWALATITVEEEYPLNYSNSTPTINESKTQFAIRSKNTILIHDKELLDSFNFTQTHHFELNGAQLTDNHNYSMWFQGIAMKNNQVYCLTGNEKINTEKKIYVYGLNGIVEKKIVFGQSDFNQSFYEKFEPESLTFKNNELYFTIMTKNETTTGNIKYLYRLDI